MRTLVVLCVVWVWFAIGVQPSAGVELAPVPQVMAPLCSTPPIIDGDPVDPGWKHAAALGGFHILKEPGVTSDAVRARLMRDERWLYLFLEIDRPHVQTLMPTAGEHDGDILRGDSLEVFLDPGTAGKLYFHYALNAANVRSERRVFKGAHEMKWDVPWRSATRITDKGWVAELAIPLFVLVELGDYRKTTLNVCVNRIELTLGIAGEVIASVRQNLSWSAVSRRFHEPDRFGLLLGLDQGKIRQPWLPGIEGVTVSSYQVTDRQFSFTVEGDVVTDTSVAGEALLTLTDRPLSGEERTLEQTVSTPGVAHTRFLFRVPVTTPASRTVRLDLKHSSTGEVLQRLDLKELSSLSLLGATLDRNYYTSETHAQAFCQIGLPAGELVGTTLCAVDAQGKMIGRNEAVQATTMLAIPLATLPVGSHALRIELRGRDGQPLFGENVSLHKREPKPGLEWKINQIQRVMLNNGEPFFPYGVVYSGGSGAEGRPDPYDPLTFNEFNEMGFNTLVRFGPRVDPSEATRLLDVARDHHLYVIEWLKRWHEPTSVEKPGGEEPDDLWETRIRDRYIPGIAQVKNHPALIGYLIFDEPRPDPRILAMGRRLDDLLREHDGYHIASVNYNRVPAENEDTSFMNVIMSDPYWIPGRAGIVGSPNHVSARTLQTRARVDRELKVTCLIPASEVWSGTYMRSFLPQEQWCQTYLALIHGAKGIIYFNHIMRHQSTYDTFVAMGQQMKTLIPIALAADIPQMVTYSQGRVDDQGHDLPDVQVSLRRNPAGGYVLLAANSAFYPVSVKYSAPWLSSGEKVGSLFDDGTLPVVNGAFSDALEPLATRAYTLVGPADFNQAAEVRVDMTPHKDQIDPIYSRPEIPKSGRPGKRNILQNPGFETATLAGWPDYFVLNGVSPRPRIGNPQKHTEPMVLVTEKVQEGRVCLQFRNTTQGATVTTYLSPRVARPTPFTISASVRANRANTGIRVNFLTPNGPADQVIVPTTEWRRFTFTFDMPLRGGVIGIQFNPGPQAVADDLIWVDGMQVEAGTEATAYEQ